MRVASRQLFGILEGQRAKTCTTPLNERHQNSLAFGYRGAFNGGLSLQADLRHSNDNRFDDVTGWNLTAFHQLSDRLPLQGSAGLASLKPSCPEI